jgi:hypothetical protein
MRRIWLKLAFCSLLFFFSSPGTADAQIWRFIYELSGPGPFNGLEWEWRVFCLSEPDRDSQTPAAADRGDGLSRALQILGPGCLFHPVPLNEVRRASFNVSFGVLNARHNDLRYTNLFPAGILPPSRDVKLTTLEPTFWWRPLKTVEVGTGAGFLWFSGEAFDWFQRGFLEPFRLDVRPVALIGDVTGRGHAEWTEAFSFRASLVITPAGFRAENFGAIPGTFQTAREVLPSFSVYFDIEPIARQIRKARAARR